MTIDPLPPGLARNSRLDRWVEIRTDGVVEVRTGKVEIGQGITSALAQIAAEELDVDYARIRMIPADTGRSPNEGVTAGSRSTMDGGGALRQACAEVRDAFLQAAARRLNAGVDELFVRDGTVHRKASNESATYWELSAEVDLSRDADGRAAPKRADQLTLVGKPLPRLDLPDKVAGAGVYVHDLELPGMLHGRVVRPPSYRAVLKAFDGKRIETMPGVRAVVRDGRFLGVVAEREEQAVAAAAALAKGAVWQEAADLPDVDAMPAFLRSRPSKAKMLSEKGVPQTIRRARRERQLFTAVPGPRVDRAGLRGGAGAGRRHRGVVPEPVDPPDPAGHRQDARRRARHDHRSPCAGRRMLRSQRGRRRGARRGAARPRRGRPPGAAAMVARGRTGLVAVRAGDGRRHERRGR